MLPPGDCGLRFLGIKCVFVGLALLLGVSPVFISCVMRDMVISKPLRALLFVLAHLACSCKYPSDVSSVFVLTKSLCVYVAQAGLEFACPLRVAFLFL